MNYLFNSISKQVTIASVALLVLLQFKMSAQGIAPLDLNFPSPNAASLGNFTECPVSLFTGLPQITIPLHQMQGKRISVSISLGYHGGGIRPELHPGWTGNGWDLVAGGLLRELLMVLMMN